MVLALILIVLCGRRGIGRETTSQKLSGRHLAKCLNHTPVHKHIAPRLPLKGWIQVPGILGIIIATGIGGLAVKLAVTAFSRYPISWRAMDKTFSIDFMSYLHFLSH